VTGHNLTINCEKALLFSDIHCRTGGVCDPLMKLLNVASKESIDCLIILGDLFDDLHERMDSMTLKREMLQLGFKEYRGRHILYTPSSSSHDPIVGKSEFELNGVKVCVNKVIKASLGDLNLCLTHGDMLVPNGAVAYAINAVSALAGKSLLLEELTKRRICSSSAWFFMGHTHIPGLDPARRLGNPGSWRREWRGRVPYWRRPSNSAILYEGKRFRLVFL